MPVPEIFRDYNIGWIAQSVWGTAPSAADAVTWLNVDAVAINPMVNFRETLATRGARVLNDADLNVDTKELTPEIVIAGEVDKLEVVFSLYLFFQNVVEGETTPFDKTYTFLSTQPDFAADGGYFTTLVLQVVDASKDRYMIDCVAKELKFTCDPAGKLRYSMTLLSRGAVNTAFNSTGTWTTNALTHYHYSKQAAHSINFGSGAQDIVLVGGWELTFTKELLPYGQDGAGEAYSFVESDRRAVFNSTILNDDNADSAIANLVVGTAADLRIGWGNATPGTVDGDLDFAMHGKFTKAELNNEAPAGVEIEMVMSEKTGTEAITVIAADAVDQTW